MPAGSVLEPGQTYTITLRMMLRPGLTPSDFVTNTATIDVAEPLDQCVPSYDAATGLCADTATVRPLAVPALSTVKFVRADNPPEPARIPRTSAATPPGSAAQAPRRWRASTGIRACRSPFRATPRRGGSA